MPEDTTLSTDEEQEAGTSGIVHDDIMQRLLEYQRQLREGLSPDAAAEASETEAAVSVTATEGIVVVDITEAEAEIETVAAEALEETDIAVPSEPEPAPAEVRPSPSVWAAPPAAATAGSTDLSDRIARLESTLERVSGMLGDLRTQFQDMTIAADERLAAIEHMLSETRTTT